jgi:hypothetical protein
MTLAEFVTKTKVLPIPSSVVSKDMIVDGIAKGKWTPEMITAEAFNQDILSVDTDTWETALAKVKALL